MSTVDELLLKTSRTFALAIPMLPEPTRRAVGVAYLLFRIADTFEDAAAWPRERRIESLTTFAELLEQGQFDALSARVPQWLTPQPIDHAGYLELLRETPMVLREVLSLSPGARAIVLKHTVRTTRGMAGIVARGDAQGSLQLQSIEDLQDYCYVVAGIVGELLTDLFLHDAPQLAAVRGPLEASTKAFGEGLQLVNILKDSGDDAREGRVYLPASVDRDVVMDLARSNLDAASAYIGALQQGGAPKGYLGFTGISVLLARAALDSLEENGPGAKVSRLEVMRLMGKLQSDLAANKPMQLATAAA
jgi:farnesyl-diphosphate farnesyltransferase